MGPERAEFVLGIGQENPIPQPFSGGSQEWELFDANPSYDMNHSPLLNGPLL